jgi:hypothetical protein
MLGECLSLHRISLKSLLLEKKHVFYFMVEGDRNWDRVLAPIPENMVIRKRKEKETTFPDETVKATRINQTTNIGRTGQSQTRTMSTGSPISFWLIRYPVDSKQFRPANVTTPID